jgi:hypothetical protein
MALLVPNEGEIIALEAFVGKTAGGDQNLKLFQSNTTPSETDTNATYTEATWTGYAAIAINGASWGAASGGAPSSIAYAQQTFTSSAGSQSQNNYGYYVTQTTTNKLKWAERFGDGPYTIVNNGDQIKVTPTVTAD